MYHIKLNQVKVQYFDQNNYYLDLIMSKNILSNNIINNNLINNYNTNEINNEIST